MTTTVPSAPVRPAGGPGPLQPGGPGPWSIADPVGAALHRLRVTGLFYSRTEAAAPWAVDMPALGACVSFHVVTAGECHVDVDGTSVHLRAGDLALVPHGRGHVLRSAPGVPSLGRVDTLPQEYVTDQYSVLRHDGPGPRTLLVCGILAVDGPASRHLLALLPPVVHVPAGRSPWVADTLRLMTAEVEHARPGGEAVTTRLADVLVVQAVRAWIDTQDDTTGWLAALRDPHVGRAVAAVHADPAAPWTVAALARHAALSRSAFAERFTAVAGVPAMTYVTRWRMHVAEDRLRQGETVARVAAATGYESEAAFSRAFSRETGRPPGAVRRAATGAP
ncbi:cupin domain-containing protein [Cellulomonas sp. 179-A 9B4 NHS]